jgi:hypothetical protein
MKTLVQKLFRLLARELGAIGIQQRLQDRAWKDTVDYLYSHINRNCEFFNQSDLIRGHAFRQIPPDGMILEFGVHQGISTRYFSQALKTANDERKIIGFDNFRGLTEDWTGMSLDGGHQVRARFFNLQGKPSFTSDNVEYIVGDIEETLGPFLQERDSSTIAFIHIDTDTYTPAKVILENCRPYLRPNSIILFDQLLGYPGYQFHEFAALNEIFDPHEYRFIGFGIAQEKSNLVKAAIQIN